MMREDNAKKVVVARAVPTVNFEQQWKMALHFIAVLLCVPYVLWLFWRLYLGPLVPLLGLGMAALLICSLVVSSKVNHTWMADTIALLAVGPIFECLLWIQWFAHWRERASGRGHLQHPGTEILTFYTLRHYCNICVFVLSLRGISHFTQSLKTRVKGYVLPSSWKELPEFFSDGGGVGDGLMPVYKAKLEAQDFEDVVIPPNLSEFRVNQDYDLVEKYADLSRIGRRVFIDHESLVFVPSLRDPTVWVTDPGTGGYFPYVFGELFLRLFRVLKAGMSLSEFAQAHPDLLSLYYRIHRACVEARIVHTESSWESDVAMGKERVATAKRDFAVNGYAVMSGLFEANPLSFAALRRYYHHIWVRKARKRDASNQVDELYFVWWREPFANHLTNQFTQIIREITGDASLGPERPVSLWYPPGSIIAAHVDEYPPFLYSLSILIDKKGKHLDEIALFLITARNGKEERIGRAPGIIGDSLVFRGQTFPHFRERIPDDTFVISLSMAWDRR